MDIIGYGYGCQEDFESFHESGSKLISLPDSIMSVFNGLTGPRKTGSESSDM